MTIDFQIAILPASGFEESYREAFAHALKWINERDENFDVFTYNMAALDNNNIPRQVCGRKIEKMTDNSVPSRSSIILFAHIPHEIKYSPDHPTAVVVPALGPLKSVTSTHNNVGFWDFINATGARIIAAQETDLGEVPLPEALSDNATEFLESIDGEYQGYGRSLHGSTLSWAHIKTHAESLASTHANERSIEFWLWQNGWEGTSVKEILDLVKKARKR